MLAAISRTTLLDDVWRQDPTTVQLESLVASLLGHDDGLLVLSGTMGNQLALRAHLGAPPHSVVLDERSHLRNYEAGGLAHNSGGWPIFMRPSGGRQYVTLDEFRRAAVLDDEIHGAPTRVVSLENTLHGSVMPLEVCQEISSWAREHGILMHLDGARLWEAVAAQAAAGAWGGSLVEGMRTYGRCFDTVTVCFSKGLGAPIGSCLAGSKTFVKSARHIRKSLGGGMRQTGVIAAPAITAVHDTFFEGRLRRGQAVATEVGALWVSKGGKLVRPVETNMAWLDLSGRTEDESREMQARWNHAAEREGIQVRAADDCRVICHYQVCDEAIERLGRAMDAALGLTEDAGTKANGTMHKGTNGI